MKKKNKRSWYLATLLLLQILAMQAQDKIISRKNTNTITTTTANRKPQNRVVKISKRKAQKVNAEDFQMVSRLFATYFRALSQNDKNMLVTTLAPVLTSFLHKEPASQKDVLQYMAMIHEPDITQMEFVLNYDWMIEKKFKSDQNKSFFYQVVFTVDQIIERSDLEKENLCTYKVSARISTEGKIMELNMRRRINQSE